MIIERLSEDTLFLPISARKGVFLLLCSVILPIRRPPDGLQKDKVQNLRFWTLSFLSFDEIIVLGNPHHEINRIGDVEQ